MRPAGIQAPDIAEEGTVKSWLDALAGGSCDAPAFLRAMHARFSADPDGTFEVLSQLDQYYRRGRIDTETFKKIKTALAEMVLGIGTTPPAAEAPVARDVPSRQAKSSRLPAWNKPMPTRACDTQPSDSVGEPKIGRVLRRRYRIEAVIGQGGMGTVFQVLDEFRLETPGTQRLAIKVLHPAVAKRAELLAELRREFQSLQLLSHPNIIRVFDFDRDGASVFFTMELLTGAPLNRILQARKLLPLERPRALAVIRDIGAALSYAHSRGAVHGDLNLQNIFITGSGELRVMSFGASHKARQTARAADPELTLPFSSSTYASCQVLEGERADARDDVFSLACIAYLLLSGSHPFPKSTAIEARAAKLRLRRPANLTGRQWQALRSALRWERDNRPADVQQWLSELDLSGAAKRLAPLNDLLEPPAAKESASWLAAAIAAGVAVLLFAAYWVVSHRDMLPSIDSTASIRAPPAPPCHRDTRRHATRRWRRRPSRTAGHSATTSRRPSTEPSRRRPRQCRPQPQFPRRLPTGLRLRRHLRQRHCCGACRDVTPPPVRQRPRSRRLPKPPRAHRRLSWRRTRSMFRRANHRPRLPCTAKAVCAAKPALLGGPSRVLQNPALISRPSRRSSRTSRMASPLFR